MYGICQMLLLLSCITTTTCRSAQCRYKFSIAAIVDYGHNIIDNISGMSPRMFPHRTGRGEHPSKLGGSPAGDRSVQCSNIVYKQCKDIVYKQCKDIVYKQCKDIVYKQCKDIVYSLLPPPFSIQGVHYGGSPFASKCAPALRCNPIITQIGRENNHSAEICLQGRFMIARFCFAYFSGRFVNRPYKQISAEILYPLPICVIMGLHRREGA